ncbi:hypothetical protein LPJ53_004649, partial [Coemansia erecta]
ILKQVFRYAVDSSTDNKFALGAVCREWRDLALPALYRSAHFLDNSNNNMESIHPLSLAEALACCTTNLSLIMDANASRYVRQMVVFIRTEAGLLVLMTVAQAVFGGYGLVMANAHTLHVDSIVRVTEATMRLYASSFKLREQVGRMKDAFVVGMPGVVRLVLSVAFDPVLDRAFAGPLVRSYAGRLTGLEIRSPVVAGSAVAFDRLQSLSMVLDASGRSPIVARPEGLRKLELSGIPSTFAWQMFSDADGSRRLRFGQLTTLRLDFMPYTTADDLISTSVGWPSVELPQLQRLEVSNASSDHALFEECMFPRHVHTVDNRYSTEALGKLRDVETIGYMRVLIGNGELSPKVYSVLNRWFGSDGVCRDGGMQVSSTQTIDFAAVDWQRLSFLYFSERVHFGDLARLLPRVPGVRDLVLLKPVFSSPDSADEGVLAGGEPLSSGLEKLSLYGAGGRSAWASACIERLVERLPRLRTLRATVYGADEFAGFCSARQSVYPHLAGIAFESL